MAEHYEKITHQTIYKRRRLQGACDICKHKKSDSANMPNNRCSNCIAFNAECTHTNVRMRLHSAHELKSDSFDKKRTGPHSTHSNSTGETSVDASSSTSVPRVLPQLPSSTEDLLTIHPLVQPMLSSPSSLDLDAQRSYTALSQHILQLEREISNLKQSRSSASLPSSRESSSSPPTHIHKLVTTAQKSSTTNEEVQLSQQMKRLSISKNDLRHYGSSSTMSLLGVALQVGKEKNKMKIPEDYCFRRPEYWSIHPWECLPEEETSLHEFPDPELLEELIRLYFKHVNTHFPLLHRPTFEKAIREGLHFTDYHFGSTVLGVCAVASRYTDNPKVFLEGVDSSLASGWKWYGQIREWWRSSARTPSLYSMQTICLAILFTHGTSQPETDWVMVGIGIRFAQDVGAHRRKPHQLPTVESELWKRCYWVLVCVDALLCSFLGRPRATVSDDFDLDLPFDCDDEYWEASDPLMAFKQPPGKPSTVASFIAYINLMEILEYAQRTLYSVNRLKKFPGSEQTDESIVSHLDSELNQWFDGIPEHLKWASCSPGNMFYAQSAMLHACYYHVRILVHKPFIPLPSKPSPLPFPSLTICTNAARSCARIMKTHSEHGTRLAFPQVQFAVFTCGILLLVNYWTNLKSSSMSRDSNNEDLKSVQDCIVILSTLEKRWTSAGRLCDVIREIASYPEASKSVQSGPSRNGDSVDNFVPTSFQLPSSQIFPALNDTSWDASRLQDWNISPGNQSLPTGGMDATSGSWWPQTQNNIQYGPPLGPSPYGNLDIQSNSQWLFGPPSGEGVMDVSDAAMLWLQTPQMSDWMDVGRF